MGFADAVRSCFRKYVTFSGRASRPEYWWFFLFGILGSVLFGAIDNLINGLTGTQDGPTLLSGAFGLAILVPSYAVGWRRMHDTGRSGLFLLYPFIVLIGIGSFVGFLGGFDEAASGEVTDPITGVGGLILALAMLVFLASPLLVVWWLTRPSQPGPNKYGPNPNEMT